MGNVAPWLHGAGVVYPSASFDPPSVVDALVNDRCTTMIGVPTHYYNILEEVETRERAGAILNLSSLR